MADEQPNITPEDSPEQSQRSTAGSAGYTAGASARVAGETIGASARIVGKTAQGATRKVISAGSAAGATVKDARDGVLKTREDFLSGIYDGLGMERPLIGAGKINSLTRTFKARDRAGLVRLEELIKDAAKLGSESPNGELSDTQLNTLVAAATSDAGVSRMKVNVDRVAGRGILGALGGAFAGGIVGLYKDISSLSFRNLGASAILAIVVAGAALAAGVAVAALLPFAIAGAAVGMFFKTAAGIATGTVVGGIGYATFGGKKHDVDNALKAAFKSAAKDGHRVVKYRGVVPQRTQEKEATGAGQTQHPTPEQAPQTSEPAAKSVHNDADARSAIKNAINVLTDNGRDTDLASSDSATAKLLNILKGILNGPEHAGEAALKVRNQFHQDEPDKVVTDTLLEDIFEGRADNTKATARQLRLQAQNRVGTTAQRGKLNVANALTVLTRYVRAHENVMDVKKRLGPGNNLSARLTAVDDLLKLFGDLKDNTPQNIKAGITGITSDLARGDFQSASKTATNLAAQYAAPTVASIDDGTKRGLAFVRGMRGKVQMGEQFSPGEKVSGNVSREATRAINASVPVENNVNQAPT